MEPCQDSIRSTFVTRRTAWSRKSRENYETVRAPIELTPLLNYGRRIRPKSLELQVCVFPPSSCSCVLIESLFSAGRECGRWAGAFKSAAEHAERTK